LEGKENNRIFQRLFSWDIVDIVRKSWNRLEKFIFEAYEALGEQDMAGPLTK